MRSRAVGFQGHRSRPKPAGTQIRAASLDFRITYPKQEDSHAIQACYFGPRGRLIVRGDGDRVGADAAGSGGLERRQRRTGGTATGTKMKSHKMKSHRMKSSKMKSGTT